MAGSLAVAVAGFLPWSRTGSSRSGLELARTLHQVGLAPAGALGVLLILFLFTPMLAAAVCTAALSRRRPAVAALGAVTGAVALGAAMALRTSSLRSGGGVDVAMSGGILAIAGAAVLAFPARDQEGDR